MLQDFLDFQQREQLFGKEEKILLTLSGGIDSMVMCKLFIDSKLKFSIAHCNFHLRNSESDGDELFLKNFAKEKGIEIFTKHFDTQTYSESNKISIQMAARELRYNWFEEIRDKHNFAYIATGHHLDDQTETFFINIIRGTGIAGMHGILPKKDKVIRPLLFCNRKEIEHFARQNNIQYREDSSNASDKYMRNYIRHHILGEFHHLNKDFSNTLDKSIRRLRNVETVFKDTVYNTIHSMLDLQGEKIIIDVEELKKVPNLETYLYEFLGLYNFNESQIQDLIRALDENNSGTQFYSSSHRIIKDRLKIILVPFDNDTHPEVEVFEIQSSFKEIQSPLHLKFTQLENNGDIEKSVEVGLFDFNKLSFPLHIRRWKEGDYFYPLGMTNKKKLSDFFIDNKISVYDKEDSWLLCSGNDIVWVIGHRIDDRYKLTDQTSHVYRIELSNGTH